MTGICLQEDLLSNIYRRYQIEFERKLCKEIMFLHHWYGKLKFLLSQKRSSQGRLKGNLLLALFYCRTYHWCHFAITQEGKLLYLQMFLFRPMSFANTVFLHKFRCSKYQSSTNCTDIKDALTIYLGHEIYLDLSTWVNFYRGTVNDLLGWHSRWQWSHYITQWVSMYLTTQTVNSPMVNSVQRCIE